jgi:hypothetical protein
MLSHTRQTQSGLRCCYPFKSGELCIAVVRIARVSGSLPPKMLLVTVYRRLVLAAVVLAMGMSAARLVAADSAERLTVKTAGVGIAGKFKAGFWQPVRLTVVAGAEGARGRLELVVPDGDQAPVIYANEEAAPVNLTAGQEGTFLLYAKMGPVAAPITVQLRQDGRVAWSHALTGLPPALLATQELILGIGPPVGLEEAVAAIRRQPEIALQAATVRSPAELPDMWWGYEGVDVVVLPTSDADLLAAMTNDQQAALLEWVQLGGRMVLLVGARGEEIAAAESPWRTLLPGKFTEVVPLRERSGLETFTKVTLPFEEEFFQRNRPRITRLTEVRGEVLAGEETSTAHPLVVHAAAGLGEVWFVGLDLDHPSLAAWPGRVRLLAAMLQRDQQRREGRERETRPALAHLGYQDLSGQLRTALDQFPGVTMVSITTVSVLMAVYLLLIGPGDYLLLSQLRWPRQVTWITFSLVALCFIGVALVVAGQSHGRRVRLNQVEIVDIDLARRMVRGTVWSQIYSAATTQYDPVLKIAQPDRTVEDTKGWLTWQGLPGDALGGLSSRQIALARTEPYQASMPGGELKMTGVPVSIASSKSLSGRWWGKSKLPTETELVSDQYGLLSGTFTQPLAVELTECMLAHGEKLYRLGTLRPGQTVHVDPQSSLNLEWRLTLRTVVESKDVATPWDQSSVEVPRIVQMMMFHEAARGRSYTGLTNRYQPYVDLSEHVRLGEAVLVGRSAKRVAQLTQGTSPLADPGDENVWTWYRLVLPVKAKAVTQP